MRILGIDPGIALTGWAILDNGSSLKTLKYGCVKTDKRNNSVQRLFYIASSLDKIIKKYKPKVIALEMVFFNINAKTAFSVGEARGVIKLLAAQNKIVLAEYTPLQIKTAVTGYGRASKKQVQYMIKNILSLDKVPKPDDVADALATAVTHCSFKEKLR